MTIAWRIVPERRSSDAFSGEGARIAGGRWNSKDTRIVYTSNTKSLAALELLVHISPSLPRKFKAFRLEFDDDMIEHIKAGVLPADWVIEPPGPATMAIGDTWARNAGSPVLAVPSIIIPDELNFLLNPAHPDFPKIKIHPPADFVFDPRLLT
ncbi:MAG: RES family NAD+ phosphorylase [Chthoniobacteraceae bacterium]